jgi:hypothetical protein
MIAACSAVSGPPCQRLLAADPISFEAHQCLLENYPASLPICAPSSSAISVEEALGENHRAGERVTVRGRLAMPDGDCTDMACGPAACCNDCNYGFALVGDSKQQLDLHSWRQAPEMRKDCDASAVRRWLPKLLILVSGAFVDRPIGLPADLLAPPPTRRALIGNRTCRVE